MRCQLFLVSLKKQNFFNFGSKIYVQRMRKGMQESAALGDQLSEKAGRCVGQARQNRDNLYNS